MAACNSSSSVAAPRPCGVLLYDRVSAAEPAEIIDFDPDLNRWGDVWSVFVPGVKAGDLYHFQADGPHEPQRGYRFDPQARLIDPYCKALAGDFLPAVGGIIRPPKCVVIDDEFDWQGDRHLRRNLAETIIYEMHVRGFTQARSSEVEHPGTYLGVIEKIPYLKSLGVTAVELMPVHEFPILDCLGQKPPRVNYWGYDPAVLLLAASRLCREHEPGGQVREFKEMVRAVARGRHRGDPRRGLQPHGRRERERPDPELQGAGEPRLLHGGERRPALPQLHRLRQHAQRQPSRSSAR